eukprot:6213363-Pleurochrysis_carterae.AAC.1
MIAFICGHIANRSGRRLTRSHGLRCWSGGSRRSASRRRASRRPSWRRRRARGRKRERRRDGLGGVK